MIQINHLSWLVMPLPGGIGAVLSQLLDDGCEHPVAYTSRSIAPAEKEYAQIDKEGLAIIFRV